MKKETFICNGRHFKTYEEAEAYATGIGYRISNTERLRKNVVLITLQKAQ
jgi:hypothetical protein